MKSSHPYAHKMALALDLHQTGIALMRHKLLREPSNRPEEHADERFRRWLRRKDDKLPGDVAGPVRVRSSHP